MNTEQRFLKNTLVNAYHEFFSELIEEERYSDAYEWLDLVYALTSDVWVTLGRQICLFHELSLNRSQIEDSVEAAIAELYDEVAYAEDRWSEIHALRDYGDNWI